MIFVLSCCCFVRNIMQKLEINENIYEEILAFNQYWSEICVLVDTNKKFATIPVNDKYL